MHWKMLSTLTSTVALVIFGAANSLSLAQDAEDTFDLDSGPGIRVGQTLPEIRLKDQNGKEVDLASIYKKGPVAIVFYRSADW